jgi:hypothetical protein
MVKNDDFMVTLINSLRYAFSNMSSLFVGGIVFFLSIFVIGLPFLLGFITRCMREVIVGNGILPEWDNILGLIHDGLRMMGVFIAYALAYLAIIALPAIPVLIFRQLNMPYMVLISTAALIVTMGIVASVFCVVFFASWVLYATNGSIRHALQPRKVRELISMNPAGYFIALLASIAIIIIGSISALLVLIIPWAAFAAFAALAFIYSKYYQTTIKMADEARHGK